MTKKQQEDAINKMFQAFENKRQAKMVALDTARSLSPRQSIVASAEAIEKSEKYDLIKEADKIYKWLLKP